MSGSSVPDDLRRLILTRALTVPDIEALLIFRAAPDRTWRIDGIAQRLYVTESRAARVFDALTALGAIAATTDGGYAYRARTPKLDVLLGTLEDYYSRHLVEVARLIHSTEDQAAQDFADAFRIRKDKT
jgi:hypothetical protein